MEYVAENMEYQELKFGHQLAEESPEQLAKIYLRTRVLRKYAGGAALQGDRLSRLNGYFLGQTESFNRVRGYPKCLESFCCTFVPFLN
jgi:hypothetical protein